MDKARTILLTGTGTIGSELLLALIRGTSHRVFVLFRKKDDRSSQARAVLLFEKLGLTIGEICRVSVLEGDVAKAGFGLDKQTIENLTNELDFIIHTAATTSLTADETLCETVNLGGTRNALALAKSCFNNGRLSRVIHFSTVFVVGDDSSTRVVEDGLPDAPHHFNYYESSKYEAEKLVREAISENLPATIFRPSMVVGDTRTGWTREFNVIYPLIRMLSRGHISQFPADPNSFVHLAPIDFIVEAIIDCFDNEWTCGKTFNLTSPAPVTVGELFACKEFFQSDPQQPKLYPSATFDWQKCSAREIELLESVSFCLPYFNSRHLFETANTERLTHIPKIDGNYLSLLGTFAQEKGYLKKVQNGN